MLENKRAEIKGASYIGSLQNNTVMYVTKKVEHLIQNLHGFSGCLVFAEDGI